MNLRCQPRVARFVAAALILSRCGCSDRHVDPGDDDWAFVSEVSLLQTTFQTAPNATEVQPESLLLANVSVNSQSHHASAAIAAATQLQSLTAHDTVFSGFRTVLDSATAMNTTRSGTTGMIVALVVIAVAVIILISCLCAPDTTQRKPTEQRTYTRQEHWQGSVQDKRVLTFDPTPGAGNALSSVSQNRKPPTAAIKAASAAAAAAASGPPNIAPSLILPKTEARFTMEMNSLKPLALGVSPLKGYSGKMALLNASVDARVNGDYSLGIVSPDGTVQATMVIPRSGRMEVYGRAQEPYGKLEMHGDGANYILSCYKLKKAEPVMLLFLDDVSKLKVRVCGIDSRQLGSGGHDPEKKTPEGDDIWKLTVAPGADAVLIASCVLAVFLHQGVHLRKFDVSDEITGSSDGSVI